MIGVAGPVIMSGDLDDGAAILRGDGNVFVPEETGPETAEQLDSLHLVPVRIQTDAYPGDERSGRQGNCSAAVVGPFIVVVVGARRKLQAALLRSGRHVSISGFEKARIVRSLRDF